MDLLSVRLEIPKDANLILKREICRGVQRSIGALPGARGIQ
jgi:hypothetical protein